jgi:hypothetical protein
MMRRDLSAPENNRFQPIRTGLSLSRAHNANPISRILDDRLIPSSQPNPSVLETTVFGTNPVRRLTLSYSGCVFNRWKCGSYDFLAGAGAVTL